MKTGCQLPRLLLTIRAKYVCNFWKYEDDSTALVQWEAVRCQPCKRHLSKKKDFNGQSALSAGLSEGLPNDNPYETSFANSNPIPSARTMDLGTD